MEQLLVVLDLDETLFHATTRDDLGRKPEFEVCGFSVFLRPHLAEFLAHCFDNYLVGVWTSAGEIFAAEVVSRIMDPSKLEFLWSSERCGRRFNAEQQSTHPTKPLRKLTRKGYQRERLIAIDDTPEKWCLSYGNLVRVSEYRGILPDDELLRLIHYLPALSRKPDMRAVEKRHWRSVESDSTSGSPAVS